MKTGNYLAAWELSATADFLFFFRRRLFFVVHAYVRVARCRGGRPKCGRTVAQTTPRKRTLLYVLYMERIPWLLHNVYYGFGACERMKRELEGCYGQICRNNDVQFLRRSFWNQQQLVDELSREKARELLNLLYAPGFRLSAKNPPMMKQQQRRRRSNKGRWTPYMLELPAIIEQQSCGEWCNCDNSY